jgi:mycothiol synthase
MKQAIEVDLKIRPYGGEEDVPVIVGILNAEMEADGVPNRESVDDYLSFVRNPNQNFDASRDLAIAEVDGEPIGFTEQSWVDTSDGVYREYRLHGGVRPDWRRRGIGTALLRDNERRARLLSATHETQLDRCLGSWSNERQAASTALLQANGYETVRWFFDMTRDLGEPIPEVPLPDGIEIRPVTADVIHQIWRADVEAFKDHWGGFDDSDENLKRWLDSPTFDPSLWVVAWDGDEVAAGNINAIHPEENAALDVKRGWLHSVFTRRQWRKRGLANALIARSLALLKERGMDYGVLGVDADNPTGALGLYERNGFQVSERSTAWRKPLES